MYKVYTTPHSIPSFVPVSDFNECLSGVSNCSQLCNNTDGDYHCLCYHGYLLDGDGVTCNGIQGGV